MTETRRGRLTLFLGYAAGSGKTYRMLEEAQRLRAEGVDVVVGYFEPHGRQDTIAKAAGLEFVPRHKVVYRDREFEEMDTRGILERKPQACLLDEFAHTDVPGSEQNKRWEDALILLDAGIDVLTTMNVQHLESLNDQIWQISGIRVRETVPDWVLGKADQVVMVDVTPRALLNRLERGVVYEPEKAREALQHFFKESTLVALREIALRQTAHEVDARQPAAADMGIEPRVSDNASTASKADRILICVTPDPSTAALIRRGKRVADFLHADCFAVAVAPGPDLRSLPLTEGEALDRHLNFARNLHIDTRIVQGGNAAEALVEFARLNQVTQVFLARSRKRIWLPWRRSLAQQVVRLGRDLQITIAAERHPAGRSSR